MPYPLKRCARRASPLLLLLTLTACATPYGSPLPAVDPPKTAPLPVSGPPPLPGSFWREVCAYRQHLQAELKTSLPTIEACEPRSSDRTEGR